MKKYLNSILVVEGKEDASYLSNYIDSEIVTVQGYEIPEATINYLKNKKVIIFTDPDEAGKKIRERLNNSIRDAVNIEIDIKKCTRGSKPSVLFVRFFYTHFNDEVKNPAKLQYIAFLTSII